MKETEKKLIQPEQLLIKKKIIPNELNQKENIGEKEIKPTKEEESKDKIIRRKIIPKEIKPEEVEYKIIKYGRRNPKTKVVKKLKDKEEDVLDDEIIYEAAEKPQIKRIRKKIITKNGKEEEIEEEPGKNVIYKIKNYGKDNDPQTKIIRNRTITKFGRDRQNEEDIPGDELIVKTIKEGPNKESKKIIIKKDGKMEKSKKLKKKFLI